VSAKVDKKGIDPSFDYVLDGYLKKHGDTIMENKEKNNDQFNNIKHNKQKRKKYC